MGTGAVYVTLAGLKGHPGPLTNVEAIFFFINLSLFILNSSTLILQAICAMIFPLSVLTDSLHAYCSISTAIQAINQRSSQRPLRSSPCKSENYASCIAGSNYTPGVVICDYRDRNHQLWSYSGSHFRGGDIRYLLVNDLVILYAYTYSL
jgi:hypothetical protein